MAQRRGIEQERLSMAASDQLGLRVAGILADRLKIESISDDTDLFAAAVLDSLGLVELLLGLEEEFGIRISAVDLELDRFRTVAAITAFVSSKLVRHNGHEVDFEPRRAAMK
jgi:D-alanine--poly(phosphoribitol) ligase subunit 2